MKALKTGLLFVSALVLFLSSCWLNNRLTSKIFESQPSWYFLNPESYKKFSHIMGVGFGYRSLLADFEYITFLQYYGNKDNRKTNYSGLYSYIDSITDADPHFTFAYIYGSAILGFNVQRHDEAIKVINKGLEFNPKIWRLRLYLGALTFSKLGEKEKYVKFLEEALKFDDHPQMIETLLGNIYAQYKEPDETAMYWAGILKNSKHADSRKWAEEKITEMISEGRIKEPEKILKYLEKQK
jgi:tetratricopeptide (TPR) repeat protein